MQNEKLRYILGNYPTILYKKSFNTAKNALFFKFFQLCAT